MPPSRCASRRDDEGFPASKLCSSPADAQSDRAEVSGNFVIRTVFEAELGVDFQVRPNFACDAAAEILAELIHARVKKVSADRKAPGVAMSPPGKEAVAPGTGKGGRGIQLARTVEEAHAAHDVPTPISRDGDIDDRAEIVIGSRIADRESRDTFAQAFDECIVDWSLNDGARTG